MAVQELSAQEVREIVAEKGITADQIPTYGLKFFWRGRDVMIGLVRAGDRAGEIVGFDITLYEDGQRVSPTLAYLTHVSEEIYAILTGPFYYFGKWGSKYGIDDKVIGTVILLAAIWTIGSIKNILK